MNDEYMYRGQKVKRDSYIRLLVDNERMTLDAVASKVNLDKSSVSRIYNGTQNLSGTGKGGPKGPRRRRKALLLGPGPFLTAAENIIATIESEPHRILFKLTDEQVRSLIKRLSQAATQLLNEHERLSKLREEIRKRNDDVR